jgi:hypothetical protein
LFTSTPDDNDPDEPPEKKLRKTLKNPFFPHEKVEKSDLGLFFVSPSSEIYEHPDNVHDRPFRTELSKHLSPQCYLTLSHRAIETPLSLNVIVEMKGKKEEHMTKGLEK